MVLAPKENQTYCNHISMIQSNKTVYDSGFVHAQPKQLLAREQKDLVSYQYRIRQT